MAKRNRTSKKRRQQLREDHQRAQRMRWIRIGGLVLLVVVALGTFGFYRASTAPSEDAPSELMPDNNVWIQVNMPAMSPEIKIQRSRPEQEGRRHFISIASQ